MTSDDRNQPDRHESERPREIPLGKMWSFGAIGAIAAVAALLIVPTNPVGWVLLAALSVLVWVTRVELRRRQAARQPNPRS
ncbi:hypothetical protein [Micromonospora sp. NPDC049301]|uniref:hypothetical protein n=1 Tax=Micromonospora sp. NPDC049301 TaxID=3155723 RepID=UPI00344AE8A9